MKSNRGISLVELLIAGAIMGVVGVAAGKLWTHFIFAANKHESMWNLHSEMVMSTDRIKKQFALRMTPRGADPLGFQPVPPTAFAAVPPPCTDFIIRHREIQPGINRIVTYTFLTRCLLDALPAGGALPHDDVSCGTRSQAVVQREVDGVVTESAIFPWPSIFSSAVCFRQAAGEGQIRVEAGVVYQFGSTFKRNIVKLVLPIQEVSQGIEFLPN